VKPDPRFLNQNKDFWAYVRLISQEVGYTVRGQGQIKIPSVAEIQKSFAAMDLDTARLITRTGDVTSYGRVLCDYFAHRAKVLYESVEPSLMTMEEAKRLFSELRKKLKPKCPIPLNKQSGKKKSPAFFTGIINMLIEANSASLPCDCDPRRLTVITRNGNPVRTLSRRVDGAFPCATDPVAIWEIKEYYYTTTFGSRVADGVYETLVDGLELEELRLTEGIDVRHYLMIDAHYTWWECGRSYLCRLIDMLHMGYVDEVLFGREVVSRLPELVREWATATQEHKSTRSRKQK
jgi:hypothetical protein